LLVPAACLLTLLLASPAFSLGPPLRAPDQVPGVESPPASQELAHAVRAYLAAVSPWKEDEITVLWVSNPEGIPVADGDLQLQVAARTRPSTFENMLLPVESASAGNSCRTFWVKAGVRVQAKVVRVAGRVPYRSLLRALDLEEAVSEIKDPRAEYVRTLDEAVGMVAKRALLPGDLLNVSWVEGRDLVRRGDTVRLVAQRAGINVSILARALQTGKLGDHIRVRNLESNRALKALVTGPGEATVQQ
jgi:flagella basal body P-ring formation protein FlgA